MNVIERELRVAFSKHAQPVGFRVVKWIVMLLLVYWFHDARYFWKWVGVIAVVALAVHFFYRWKTRGWTRPWGGWKDLAAVAEKEERRSQ